MCGCRDCRYRWEEGGNGEGDENETKQANVPRRVVCSGRRMKKPEKVYVHNFLAEVWTFLTPEMVDRLKGMLMNEFGMSPQEAGKLIEEQREANITKSSTVGFYKKSRKLKNGTEVFDSHIKIRSPNKSYCDKFPKSNIGIRNSWITNFSDLISGKISSYVLDTMCVERSERQQEIAQTLLSRFNNVLEQKASMTNPKTKTHKTMVVVADKLSLWLDKNVKVSKETARRLRELEDEADKKKFDDEKRRREEVKKKLDEDKRKEGEDKGKGDEEQRMAEEKQKVEEEEKSKDEPEEEPPEKPKYMDPEPPPSDEMKQPSPPPEPSEGPDQPKLEDSDQTKVDNSELPKLEEAESPKLEETQQPKLEETEQPEDSEQPKLENIQESDQPKLEEIDEPADSEPPKSETIEQPQEVDELKPEVEEIPTAEEAEQLKSEEAEPEQPPAKGEPAEEQVPDDTLAKQPEPGPTEESKSIEPDPNKEAGQSELEEQKVEGLVEEEETPKRENEVPEQAPPLEETKPSSPPSEPEATDEGEPPPSEIDSEPGPSFPGSPPPEIIDSAEEEKTEFRFLEPEEKEDKPEDEAESKNEDEERTAIMEAKPQEEGEEEELMKDGILVEEAPEEKLQREARERSPSQVIKTVASIISETDVSPTPRQEAIRDVVEKKLETEMGDEDKEIISEVASKVGTWMDKVVDQVEQEYGIRDATEVSPVSQKPKGPIFKLQKVEKDSAFNVELISNTIAQKKIREARGKVPLEPSDLKEWAKWASAVTDMAQDWAQWIEDTVHEASQKGEEYKKMEDPGNSQKDWEEFKDKKSNDAVEWRRTKKQVDHQAEVWRKKDVQNK